MPMVRRTTKAGAAAGAAAMGGADDDDRDVEAGGRLLGGNAAYSGSALAGLLAVVREALACLLGACLRGGSPSGGGGTVTINGRAFRLGRKLGEGGYSYVHLVTDGSGSQYALKRMLCQSAEQREAAAREVEAHASLAPLCPDHIAPLVDYAFVRRRGADAHGVGGGEEEALLLLPYYRGGSLQDVLAARHAAAAASSRGGVSGAAATSTSPPTTTFFSEPEALRLGAGIADALAVMHAAAPRPLAHRDVCPRNVMLGGPDGRAPVLIDLGSVAPARVPLPSRTDALRLAETAVAHSSMPYRAPELWDPPTGGSVTEATDVWSLGATLFALAAGYSPNECERGPGGTLRLAEPSHLRVLNPVAFPAPPAAPPFSPGFQRLVLDCLALHPGDRPSAAAVGARARQLLAGHGRDDHRDGGGRAMMTAPTALPAAAPSAVSRPASPAV